MNTIVTLTSLITMVKTRALAIGTSWRHLVNTIVTLTSLRPEPYLSVWMNNIKTWTRLCVEGSIRIAEDRESTSVVWSTLGSTSSRLGAVQAAKLVAGLTESGRDESYPVLGRSEP